MLAWHSYWSCKRSSTNWANSTFFFVLFLALTIEIFRPLTNSILLIYSTTLLASVFTIRVTYSSSFAELAFTSCKGITSRFCVGLIIAQIAGRRSRRSIREVGKEVRYSQAYCWYKWRAIIRSRRNSNKMVMKRRPTAARRIQNLVRRAAVALTAFTSKGWAAILNHASGRPGIAVLVPSPPLPPGAPGGFPVTTLCGLETLVVT
jgi:hypothetical protein